MLQRIVWGLHPSWHGLYPTRLYSVRVTQATRAEAGVVRTGDLQSRRGML